MIDINSELDQKAKLLLNSEYVIWLTTVGKGGTPQPRPVWFIPYNDGVLIYSRPGAAKVAHLRLQPRVALHFNTDARGDETVIVFTGTAKLDAGVPPADQVTAYIDKYREGIIGLDSNVAEFSAAYSQAIFVELAILRGW
jgi:PPOX class probable F420-dependent enzyme